MGPGAVDEYLVDATKSSFYYGQCVRLVATFSFPPATKRDLPDLTTPSSYRRDMFYGVKFSQFTDQLTGYAALDYDRDGYMDVITCISNRTYERRNLNFYKGLPDGTFAIDEKNYDRLPAPCSNRKSIYGDFNGDGLVDICFLGTGPELIDPNAKEAPVIVYSHSDGAYSEEIFSETEGFYHAGCAGDFDNDGDLDIVLIEDYPKFGIMVNDGSGNFTFDRTLLSSESILRRFTAEFIDLNHDGYLDLVVGGHEHEGPQGWTGEYCNTTSVCWGNGVTFNNDNYTRFPKHKIDGYGILLDYLFYDLDGDGQEEILNVRTGDGLFQVPTYSGWSIQIVDYVDGTFVDVTDDYIDEADNSETTGPAIVYLDMERIDGDLYLTARKEPDTEKLFKVVNGKFEKVKESTPEKIKLNNGICFYSDGWGAWGSYSSEGVMENGWPYDPYSGKTCIRCSGWREGCSLEYYPNENLNNEGDMSALSDDYSLEFYIKNPNPGLQLHFEFQSILDLENWKVASFAYDYVDNEPSSTQWKKVVIPLRSFTDYSDKAENYWKKINIFAFWTASKGGEDFYLDEIRVRKVVE